MPEEKEPPRPHGDKLSHAIANDQPPHDDNQAQVQSDAAPNPTGAGGREETDREEGRGSSANGVPAFDEDGGEQRKRLYRDGATLVSRID